MQKLHLAALLAATALMPLTAQAQDTVTLKPNQVLVIDYNAEKGGITFQ